MDVAFDYYAVKTCSTSGMIRGLSFILFLSFFVQAEGQKYMFQINDFKAFHDKINLDGSASISGERLRLTADQPNQTGACWYSAKKIDFTDGFETEFTFLISTDAKDSLPGDGFAFVIQAQSPDITGGIGNDIGFKEIPFAVAMAFDTKDDNEGSRNHIYLSFYNADTKTYRRYATVHEIPEITDGKSHFTRIFYRDGRLEVYLDSYLFPVLSVKLDIAEKINSPDHTAWLGFTASTSNQYSYHDLLSWSIKELEAPPKDIKADSVSVIEKQTLEVKNRKITISVWDYNTIDGDIISLKLGPDWLLTNYTLTGDKYVIQATLIGFNQDLILYAQNVGMVPPNTAAISVYDGLTTQRVDLESNMQTSEAIKIAYTGGNDKP
jgi:hypothetical protein